MTDIDGLIERLRGTRFSKDAPSAPPLMLEAADALAAQRRSSAIGEERYQALKADRDKLFIDWQLEHERADHNAEAAADAEKRAKEYADLYMDRCEKWSALRETLATKEKRIMELELVASGDNESK